MLTTDKWEEAPSLRHEGLGEVGTSPPPPMDRKEIPGELRHPKPESWVLDIGLPEGRVSDMEMRDSCHGKLQV